MNCATYVPLTHSELARDPHAFEAVAGMTVAAFEAAYEAFAEAETRHRSTCLAANPHHRPGLRPRKHAPGAGGAGRKVDGRTKLLMALAWARFGASYRVLAGVFGLHYSRVNYLLRDVREVWTQPAAAGWPGDHAIGWMLERARAAGQAGIRFADGQMRRNDQVTLAARRVA